MGTNQKPSIKWGYCTACQAEVRWVLGTHHSGERCYRCPGCNSWRAKPQQAGIAEAQKKPLICQLI